MPGGPGVAGLGVAGAGPGVGDAGVVNPGVGGQQQGIIWKESLNIDLKDWLNKLLKKKKS